MAEYIEKTLITTELPFVMMKYGNYFNERQIEKIVEIVYELENSIEAADVQPVKQGRWIEKPPYKDETVKGLEFQIVCSECDEQNCSLEFDENYNAIGKTFYKTRFCPNCGARMKED